MDLCVAHNNDYTVFATLECVCDMAFADLWYLIICCINFSAVHDIHSKCMHVFCVNICIILCDFVFVYVLFCVNWILFRMKNVPYVLATIFFPQGWRCQV